MQYNAREFLTSESYSSPENYSNLRERYDIYTKFSRAQFFLANPRQRGLENLNFINILESKKVDEEGRIVSIQQKMDEDLQNAIEGTFNDDLTEEANEILEKIDNEAKIKFLQLYFDSYMAPKMSDIQWRLGAVVRTMLETDSTDDLGLLINGQMYTRSNFAIPFYRRFWGGNDVLDKKEFFTSMYFPPFKVGHETKIEERTTFMKDIRKVNPNATFDQDNFLIKREGFSFREPGFKGINDYITFLQWLAEGTTGIVSTFLTEWDLSVYMQENLLTAVENGGPMKLFLNYRVRHDNPLSNAEGKYTNDRALVFNVAASAVSKIDFDCQKLWRPSDHPLSAFWMPYVKDRDWHMNNFKVENDEYDIEIPYMDIYDNTKADFPYEAKSMREIMRQQDYIGSILGTFPNFNLKYFQAFYYTDNDSLTDFEIKVQSWLKRVAGAEPGAAAQMKRGLNDFIEKAREEMLINGGYWGSPTPPGLSGGYMGRMMMKDAIGGGGGGQMTGGKMRSAASSGADNALEDQELNQIGNNDVAKDFMNSGLSNKADASTMARHIGINRFSPALFGGPHGSDFSPNTIQGYFQTDSKIMRNIPRLSPNNSNYFQSEDIEDKFTDLNQFYDDGTRLGASPNTSLEKLTNGILNYTIEYGFYRARRSTWIEGQIQFNPATNQFNTYIFPTRTPQGEQITYSGNYRFATKVITRTTNPWTARNWWYNYTAYMNIFNVSYFYRRGWRFFFVTIVNLVYRIGTYYFTGINPFRKVLFHSMPDTPWTITHHSFENFDNNNAPGSPFWNWVRTIAPTYGVKNNKEFTDRIRHKNAFILKFYGNEAKEKEFMNYMIGINQGQNASIPVIFCEGNENNRFTQGPESIFKANCTVRSFRNVIQNFMILKLLFIRIRIRLPNKFAHVPYISVDMASCDFFEDRLQDVLVTNRFHTGQDFPMHLKSIAMGQRASFYRDHPIQKFANRYFDTTVSFKVQNETSMNMLGLLVGAMLGGFVLMFAALLLAFRNRSAAASNDINWISSGRMGLSGIGILSSVQGINPSTTNLVASGINYNFRDYLAMPTFARDVPLANLPFKTFTFRGHSSGVRENDIMIRWWSRGGMPSYIARDMDDGLKKALVKIYTRAKFFPATRQSQPAAFIGIDIPIRNFLSIVLTQVSFYNFAKDCIIDSIDFETLYNSLFNCVDKAVIKACGMKADGTRIDPDKSHVLYNFWIDKAIQLFGRKSQFTSIKNNLRTEINTKITKFNFVIDKLAPLCQKNLTELTFNEICTCYNLIDSLKNETRKGLLEDFLFSYLNILYYYRLFFVAKRFNKENGTMWIMRALESVLEFIVPYASEDNPPKPPSKLQRRRPAYKIAFYELQNTTVVKQNALLNDMFLEEDRVKILYVKVKWVTKKEYDKWINYIDYQNDEIEVPEVIKVYRNGIEKYAEKPINGLYQFTSAEYLENDKNKKWNALHPQDRQRVINDFDSCVLQINWGDSPDLTPIRWDIFGTINVDNLFEYSRASVSPQELLCLIEEGADFWTINIPESLWPRVEGYRTKLKIRLYEEILDDINIKNDPYITLLGPMAYTMYPITNKQERPVPGVSAEVPEIYRHMNSGVDGFN